MGEPGFVFTSAGLTPEPVSPATVRFMAGHGFDAARAVPRALSAVPNVEHEDVIVLLAPEAKSAFPRRPRHTVLLDWSVADPSAVQGTQTEVDAAYEKIFNYISGEIHDLVSAIGDVSRP
jgi:protein-tyrosine-phosphatase